ncbi:MAG TPA: methyltransferase domain-containing protein [Solirubrobacteraceae bacterium]|nr:methyltransferase domain-containing protein [Solirubrobacteraceae bacterium]
MLSTDAQALRAEMMRLAPWHLGVEIAAGVSTNDSREGMSFSDQPEGVAFFDGREFWHHQLRSVYPRGLEGRTCLDCACNCGGYSFWTRELDGGGGLAFDARERWIEQARFLQEHREAPSDGIRFEVARLDELPALTDESFDITLFMGILYHLPDPIGGLRLVAERTRELLVINTAFRNDLPKGVIAADKEATDLPMSGVDGLCWLPSGPDVIERILASVGFGATRLTYCVERSVARPDWGRLVMLAARDERTFADLDRSFSPLIVPASRGRLRRLTVPLALARARLTGKARAVVRRRRL